jgi:two-component system response regulator FixJ
MMGNVHVVDDDTQFRDSLEYLLRDAGYHVASWATGGAFLAALGGLQDGCVLLDIRMPEIDGPAVQRAIIERQANLAVIMLTGYGDIATAVASMKAGAVDFLEKPFRRNRLLTAVDAALARPRDGVRIDAARTEAIKLLNGLSVREQEVLGHLATGLANKEVAIIMNISPRTVEVHRANLMFKLDVRRMSSALRIMFAAEIRVPRSQTRT